MRKRPAYVRTEIGRLFREKEFCFSVPGIVLILFLSANDGMGNLGDSVLSAVLLSSYDVGFLIAFSVAAIPYAAAFTDELEYHYTKYLVIRGNLESYVFSKMFVIFLSSVLTMGIGITCFSVCCLAGLPWVDEGMMEYILQSGGYRYFLERGYYLFWFFLYGTQWGILAGILSMAAAFCSLFLSNKLLVYSLPVLLYQMLTEFGADSFRKTAALDPHIIFDARYNIWNSDIKMFTWAFAAGAAAWLLFGLAGVRQLKRRM